MEVIGNRLIAEDVYQLDLTGEFAYSKAMPGQFVNILIGTGKAHPLRRPLSIAFCEEKTERLTLVYQVIGAGTKWLSQLSSGSALDILGPLGSGFPLAEKSEKVLIVGGGVGIPPLYWLSRALAENGTTLDIVLGFRNKQAAFWLEEFQKLGQVTVCTEDGSLGREGFVTAALSKPRGWTTLYSCGPEPMLKALKKQLGDGEIKGYVSLEERMACGIGACYGCVCETNERVSTKRICKDGPVFPWEEVAL